MSKYFITATDTDAGKTFIASALVSALVDAGKQVNVFKPLSAGCDWRDNQWQNEDALLLQEASNHQQRLEQINPIAFEEPIAPHIAAKYHKQSISSEIIQNHYQNIIANGADAVITEGAGGWRLPLGNGEFLSEFVQATEQKVILVVLMKLGCLNHAILTYQSIIADGLDVAGWVANCPEEMPYLEDNISLLTQEIDAPLLGKVSKHTDYQGAKAELTIHTLR